MKKKIKRYEFVAKINEMGLANAHNCVSLLLMFLFWIVETKDANHSHFLSLYFSEQFIYILKGTENII